MGLVRGFPEGPDCSLCCGLLAESSRPDEGSGGVCSDHQDKAVFKCEIFTHIILLDLVIDDAGNVECEWD